MTRHSTVQSSVLFALLLCVSAFMCLCLSWSSVSDAQLIHNHAEGTFTSQRTQIKWKDSTACAICVFALTEVEKTAKEHSKDIAKQLRVVCKALPKPSLQSLCVDLIDSFGSKFVEWILRKEQPDWICSKLSLCKKCHLVASSKGGLRMERAYYDLNSEQRKRANMVTELQQVQHMQYMGRMLGGLIHAQNEGLPNTTIVDLPKVKLDLDGDGFSPTHVSMRGADWHGRDCNDASKAFHPGRKETSDMFDTNCNGIGGKDNKSGKYHEDMYCNSLENDRQLVFFGDSASAGFSIPVEWLDLKNLNTLLDALIDELDHPDKAWGSGWHPDIHGESIYGYMRSHNRCVHRQFQNVAKNGAEALHLPDQVSKATLWPTAKPVFAMVGFIGNDVCEPNLDMMTKPADFERQMLQGITDLNARVAPGSKAILFGLVDGRILWDHMSNQSHPISYPGSKITYSDFYNFLTCTGVNPCATWLTPDAKTRDLASKRADELDDIVERIVRDQKQYGWSNIELGFLDFAEMLDESFDDLKKKGIPVNDLIDPVDGFHPSALGHRILSQVMWRHINEDYPHFIGEANPHNAAIDAKFGDQGGY